MKKQIFTLIELLITVAIIAILMSLLLPALNKAREKADSTLCQNRLKQMGIGVLSYAQDYNDWLVKTKSSRTSPPYDGNNLWWTWDLLPYINPRKNGGDWQTAKEYRCRTNRAYAKNCYDIHTTGKFSRFTSQSMRHLIMDSNDGDIYCLGFHPDYGDTHKMGYAKRHLNGANVLYLDGHTAWLSSAKCDYTRTTANRQTYFQFY